MVEILYPKEVMRFLPHYELEEIVTWKETFNTPEEYTESEREKEERLKLLDLV